MKKLLILFICCLPNLAIASLNKKTSFDTDVTNWFKAWELVYTKIYKLEEMQEVDFVFFDEEFVYSTSIVTLPEGKLVEGPKLLNSELIWYKGKHEGFLILPDRTKVRIGMLSFASANSDNPSRPFFVMPLTSFWRKMEVDSDDIALESLVTAVFLHEFSHSQQMNNFGKLLTAIESKYDTGDGFDDNYIQRKFKEIAEFTKLYKEEVNSFEQVIAKGLSQEALQTGLSVLEMRRNQFYNNENKGIEQVEDIFLTMEGLGQYTMYVWMIHSEGLNLSEHQAMKVVRRKKNNWSQDEGFLLFLILSKLKSPELWIKDMFGDKVSNVLEEIKKSAK